MTTAIDADVGDVLTFSALGLPVFAVLNDNGDGSANLEINPGFADAGDYTITITVSDDGIPILTDNETFDIVVGGTNRAPVLSAINNQSVSEGESINVSISATDADVGDVLTISAIDLPMFATLTDNGDGTASLVVNPGFDDAGTYPMSITVIDNGSPNLSDSETFNISVGGVNQAPVLGAIGNQSVAEGDNLSVTLTATDTDIGDILTFSANVLPDFVLLSDNGNGTANLSINPGFANSGAYTVTITVTDNGTPTQSDRETFDIVVSDTNQAPVLDPIGDQNVAEQDSLTVAINASDGDNDMLVYSSTVLPAFAVLTDNGNGTASLAINPSFADSGTYPVTITVSDDGAPNLTDDETFNIIVSATNRAPELNPIGDHTAPGGGNLTLTISATDADVNDTLVFSVSDLPAFTVLNDNRDGTADLVINPSVDDVGSYSVTVTVADDGVPSLSDEETFAINVLPPVMPIDITPLNLPLGDQGKPYRVVFGAIGSIAPYQFRIESDAPGMTTEGENSNILSGIPSQAGNFNVQVTALSSSIPPLAGTRAYTLFIRNSDLGILNTQLNKGLLNASYGAQLMAAGGIQPYRWTTLGGLPPGLNLLSSGLITGIPTHEGDYNITVMVNDNFGTTAQRDYTISILAINLKALTPQLPNGIEGEDYSVPLLVGGGSLPYLCQQVSGVLPPGLSVRNPDTEIGETLCYIEGTPEVNTGTNYFNGRDFTFGIAVQDQSKPSYKVENGLALNMYIHDPQSLPSGPPGLKTGGVTEGVEEIGSGSPGEGYPDEDLQDMATDAYGNHYVVGYAFNGEKYILNLLKFDSDGYKLWHQLFDIGSHNYGYGVTVAPDQSVYVVGYLLSKNIYKGLIVKYNSDGLLQWHREYDGGNLTDAFYKVAADHSGAYVVGEHYNGSNFDAQIIKYNHNGSLVWRNTHKTSENDIAYAVQLIRCLDATKSCHLFVGGARKSDGWLTDLVPESGKLAGEELNINGAIVESMVADHQGNVYIGGTFRNGDWLVMNSDESLSIRWTESYSWSNQSRLRALSLDRDGYLYAVGHTHNTDDDDVLIAVFDGSGKKIEELIIDKNQNQYGHGVAVDMEKNLIVSGQAKSPSGSNFLMYFITTN